MGWRKLDDSNLRQRALGGSRLTQLQVFGRGFRIQWLEGGFRMRRRARCLKAGMEKIELFQAWREEGRQFQVETDEAQWLQDGME